MRWKTWLGLTLSLAACRETVVLDQGPFDGSVGGVDGAPTNCGAPVSFTPPSPKVMVALDRSDGMFAKYGDSTPFAIARNALDQYSALYQNAIWFGYLDFPGTFCMGMQMCCPGTFSAPTGDVNSFSQALHTCDRTSNPPCGSPTGYQRPTAAALYSCSSFIFSQSDMVHRYILLITNGRPDCGSSGPGPCGDGEETHGVIGQLTQGPRYVRTYVVAPGQSSSDQCLPDLAAAGGTGDSRSTDLTYDIGNILHTIATDVCDINVQEPIKDSGRVEFDYKTTQQIPHDRNLGWEVSSSGYTISLHDKWCERLIDEGKNAFTLYTGCPSPPRP
jgi:hypothetical protein